MNRVMVEREPGMSFSRGLFVQNSVPGMFMPSVRTATVIELPMTRSQDRKTNTSTELLFRKSAYMRKIKSKSVMGVVSGKK